MEDLVCHPSSMGEAGRFSKKAFHMNKVIMDKFIRSLLYVGV